MVIDAVAYSLIVRLLHIEYMLQASGAPMLSSGARALQLLQVPLVMAVM